MQAQIWLGWWHRLGQEGMEKDEVKAMAWFHRAADLGDLGAQLANLHWPCATPKVGAWIRTTRWRRSGGARRPTEATHNRSISWASFTRLGRRA